MIWRVILFWLLGASLAWADLPRHSFVASVCFCRDSTALLNYWGHPLDGYAYQNDSWGLRTNITRQRGLTTNIISAGYDGIGELASWTAKESSGIARQNEQLGYGYDASGNLYTRTNGALNQTFTVNPLNQVSSVTSSGLYTVTGATPASATSVTVNTTHAAQLYGDFTFAATNNPLSAYGTGFTINAQNAYGSASNTAFSPPLSVTTSYDANGNLTYSGNAPLGYDAENRLTNVIMGSCQVGFVYDGLNRLRIERYYGYQGGGWVPTNEVRLIYDGLQVIQERDTNSHPLVTYTRGLDLSMSLDGTGGIGGMLARTDTNGSAFYHSDGAGNITAVMDGNQNMVARYEYDAYGRLVGKWGNYADINRYRFSSKEYIVQAGVYYFGQRFYEPNFQRWLNRDPIQEAGGINLYQFVGNNPVNYVDPYGLTWVLFDSQAWGQLLHNIFYGANYQSPFTFGPQSQLGMRNAAGVGVTQLTDENGNRVQPGNVVPGALFSAAGNIMMLPMGEEEGAFKAAEEALQAAEAAKAAKLAKCKQALMNANPVGSALKADKYHNAATFMRDAAAQSGTDFDIVGADAITRTLVQIPGTLDGQAGRFEYIIDQAGNLTHQLFVPGGGINGTPIIP